MLSVEVVGQKAKPSGRVEVLAWRRSAQRRSWRRRRNERQAEVTCRSVSILILPPVRW